MTLFFVVAHKPAPIPQKPGFVPVLVGKKDFTLPGAIRDDEGDNIAEKNPCYCELTAQYAMWKNPPLDADYVALAHYRRYFTTRRFSGDPRFFLDGDTAEQALQNADVLLAAPRYFSCTVGENYYRYGAGKQKDLEQTERIIQEKYPAYHDAFRRVTGRNHASYYNMFVMSRSHFEKYCGWLFDVLFTLEERTDLSGYTPAQRRIFGYLSEILLNVWVEQNHLRIRYMPVAETEAPGHYAVSYLRKQAVQWKHRISYRVRTLGHKKGET